MTLTPAKIFVYAVALLLLISVVLFIKAALFDRRPQKLGLIAILASIPLYAVYYADLLPIGGEVKGQPLQEFQPRIVAQPLKAFHPTDIHFHSVFVPAFIIAIVLLVHMTVFQRVAVRQRLQRIHDPIATVFAGATMATLIGATIVSAYQWGWIGALIVGLVLSLVYLGALALLAAIIEITVETSKLFAVWVKRKVFALATLITRSASWISSLGGRLVSRQLIEKIREDTARQENIFVGEQDDQDRRLEDAYVRDRRRAAKRRGKLPEQLLGPDPSAPAASRLAAAPVVVVAETVVVEVAPTPAAVEAAPQAPAVEAAPPFPAQPTPNADADSYSA